MDDGDVEYSPLLHDPAAKNQVHIWGKLSWYNGAGFWPGEFG